MKNITNLLLIGGLLLSVSLGCKNQRNSNSVANQSNLNSVVNQKNLNSVTNQKNSNSVATANQSVKSEFTIPPDSVPATEITRDFDDKLNDLKVAIKKWRNKRVTFHGIVFAVERKDNGKFDISLAGHDNYFTVFCEDIPASQADIVAKLKEDETTIAISGVILGNGITGMVPGQVDHDVKAEKCKIVE